MDERRRNTRSKLESKLMLKRLEKEEKEIIIDVADVSKTGVGFVCDEPLVIGAVVRIEKTGNTFNYGGIFVGMPDMDSARIEVYQMFEQEN